MEKMLYDVYHENLIFESIQSLNSSITQANNGKILLIIKNGQIASAKITSSMTHSFQDKIWSDRLDNLMILLEFRFMAYSFSDALVCIDYNIDTRNECFFGEIEIKETI